MRCSRKRSCYSVRCCWQSAFDDRLSFAIVLSDVMIPVRQANRQSNVLLSSTTLGQQASVQRKEHNSRIPHLSKLSHPGQRRSVRRTDVSKAVATTTEAPTRSAFSDQSVREGSYESALVQLQVGYHTSMLLDPLNRWTSYSPSTYEQLVGQLVSAVKVSSFDYRRPSPMKSNHR